MAQDILGHMCKLEVWGTLFSCQEETTRKTGSLNRFHGVTKDPEILLGVWKAGQQSMEWGLLWEEHKPRWRLSPQSTLRCHNSHNHMKAFSLNTILNSPVFTKMHCLTPSS